MRFGTASARSLFWLVAAATAACGSVNEGGGNDGGGDGGSGDAPADFASGERMRAVYWDGGDGATLFQHWHDSELGLDCRLGTDESGQLRCFPIDGVNLVYLAADCTQPALEPPPCGASPPDYVTESISVDCGPQEHRAFTVGSAVTRMTSYYVDQTGDCIQVDHTEPATFHPLTPVDPTSLASAELRRVELDSGLGVEIADLEGGGHQILSAVSTAHDATCSPTLVGDATAYQCRYGTIGWDFGDLHSDAACTGQDVAYTLSCDKPDFIFQSRPTGGTCGGFELQAILTAGDPVDAGDVYQGTVDSCRPIGATSRRQFWSLGADAVNDFPEVATVWLGDGGMQVQHFATPAGTHLIRRSGWRDNGADCAVLDTAEGLRCFADPWVYRSSNVYYYSDDACTEEIARAQVPSCDDFTVPVIYLESSFQSCGVPTGYLSARAVGAEHTGPVYRSDEENTICSEHTVQSYEKFFALGAAVPLTDYPEIRVVTE